MTSTKIVADHFRGSITTLQENAEQLGPSIARGAGLMIDAIRRDGKVMACGNGGSAADAQHFSAELLNRFERDRRPLPGLSLSTDTSTLTSIANDYSYDEVFAKQIQALGRPEDVLLMITTSGGSTNLLRALAAAHGKRMRCVALNGRDGGTLSGQLTADDVDIVVRGASTARIQEVHSVVIHCFCDLIDQELLGQI